MIFFIFFVIGLFFIKKESKIRFPAPYIPHFYFFGNHFYFVYLVCLNEIVAFAFVLPATSICAAGALP